MRIISKFSDYYDSAMGMGIDKSRVFVRKAEEIWEEKPLRAGNKKILSGWERFKPEMIGYSPTVKRRDFYITPFSIVFCGKVYYGLKLRTVREDYSDVVDFMYTVNQVRKVYHKHRIKYNEKPKYASFFHSAKPDNIQDIERYLVTDTKHEQFLIDKKIAIGVYMTECPYDTFIANPRLKDFGFQKVFSPYQAFQELDMFVSGVLPDKDNAMANISDEDLLKGKGFDCYSFKKEPTKHKRKVCK